MDDLHPTLGPTRRERLGIYREALKLGVSRQGGWFFGFLESPHIYENFLAQDRVRRQNRLDDARKGLEGIRENQRRATRRMMFNQWTASALKGDIPVPVLGPWEVE